MTLTINYKCQFIVNDLWCLNRLKVSKTVLHNTHSIYNDDWRNWWQSGWRLCSVPSEQLPTNGRFPTAIKQFKTFLYFEYSHLHQNYLKGFFLNWIQGIPKTCYTSCLVNNHNKYQNKIALYPKSCMFQSQNILTKSVHEEVSLFVHHHHHIFVYS